MTTIRLVDITQSVCEPIEEVPEPIFGRDFPVFGEYSIEKVIEAVGDSGIYQKMIVILSMFCLFGSSFVSFSLSFFASEPLFTCE